MLFFSKKLNMVTPKISVIVPVYNVEQYLSKCIESILSQTFTDFELLLINDGTPDQSGVICDEYAKKDARIRVFHTKNKGVSSARNLGLDEALGEWVAFVDSDDSVEERYLADLYAGILKDKIGFIMQGFSLCDETGKVFHLISFDKALVEHKHFDLIITQHNAIKYGHVCSKLYQLATIRNNNLYFDIQIHRAEDLIFMLEYIQYCDYIYFIQGSNYNYLRAERDTLSKRYNSHDSEMLGYRRCYTLLMRCKQLFNLNESTLTLCYPYACNFIFRSIYTMYRSEHYISRKERLKILNNLTDLDLCLIGKYGYQGSFSQKIQIKLLSNKLFIIFDLIKSFYNR